MPLTTVEVKNGSSGPLQRVNGALNQKSEEKTGRVRSPMSQSASTSLRGTSKRGTSEDDWDSSPTTDHKRHGMCLRTTVEDS